jgi:hypothetical protein
MKIQIELLRQLAAVRELLREEGWRLDKTASGYSAEHPEARDESAARQNLQDLGLLASAAVRIEFPPPRRGPAPAAGSADYRRRRSPAGVRGRTGGRQEAGQLPGAPPARTASYPATATSHRAGSRAGGGEPTGEAEPLPPVHLTQRCLAGGEGALAAPPGADGLPDGFLRPTRPPFARLSAVRMRDLRGGARHRPPPDSPRRSAPRTPRGARPCRRRCCPPPLLRPGHLSCTAGRSGCAAGIVPAGRGEARHCLGTIPARNSLPSLSGRTPRWQCPQ